MPISPDKRREYNQNYYRRHTKQKRALTATGAEKKLLIGIRMPVSVVARLQKIVIEGVAFGHFPWKTQGQLINALLMRGLESLASDPDIEEMMPYLRALGQTDNLQQQRTEAQAAFSRIKTELAELYAINAQDAAVNHFHAVYDTLEDMTPGVWRDWLLQKLESTFPELAKAEPITVNVFKDEKPKLLDRRTRPRSAIRNASSTRSTRGTR